MPEANDKPRETEEAGQEQALKKDTGKHKEAPDFKVTDRRHWARSEEQRAEEQAGENSRSTSPYPTVVDEYKQRAEAAEQKLHEYIAAFKRAQDEQEQFRERLQRDVDRRVELKFCGVLAELLETVDDLDLALSHVKDVPEAAPLAEGVAISRDRFLATLEKHGVERIEPDHGEFDPNLAEAMRTEPVDSPKKDGKVIQTLRPGYRLGERVIRPARVTVGKFQG